MLFEARAIAMVRAAGLLLLGALAMHALRNGIDPSTGATPWASGHAYLAVLTPLLAAAGTSLAVVAVARSALSGGAAPRPSTADRAARYAAGLLSVHLVQEGFEAAAAGAGAAEILVALITVAGLGLPLAMALGALAAVLARLLDRAEHRLAGALRSTPLAAARPAQRQLFRLVARTAPLLSLGGAPRPPPRAG